MSDLVQWWQFREKLELEGRGCESLRTPCGLPCSICRVDDLARVHGVVGRAHRARVDAQWSAKSRGLLILCSAARARKENTFSWLCMCFECQEDRKKSNTTTHAASMRRPRSSRTTKCQGDRSIAIARSTSNNDRVLCFPACSSKNRSSHARVGTTKVTSAGFRDLNPAVESGIFQSS